VDSYRKQSPGGMPTEDSPASPLASDGAGRLLRRLIPYPAAADAVPYAAMTALSPGGSRAQAGPVSSVVSPTAGRETASIVSEAASILDEEMAKGVLAARSTGQAPRYGRSDSSTIWLRQLHDLVDNVAELWPSMQGPSGLQSALYAPAASSVSPESLPELKPRSPARPGERAIIQMTLCNKENHPVRLVPVATDLLGSKGDRIACHLLQFTPSEIRLGPGEQRELEIGATVPLETLPGCYAGLLVVTGVEYLRALITIEVI
jgi:hypothetical protein